MLQVRWMLLLLFMLAVGTLYGGMQDSTVMKRPRYSPAVALKYLVRDSARFARALEKQRLKDSLNRVEDSLHLLRDSLQFQYLRPLTPNSKNQFLDSLKKIYINQNGNTLQWGKQLDYQGDKQLGIRKVYRPKWILWVVFGLFLFLGVIRMFFMKDLEAIATSFYSNRVLLQVSKEDNLVTSWPFVFLYLLFGFTIGLFLYLYVSYNHIQVAYLHNGLFLSISLMVLVLFIFKIVITRSIGFVFGIQKLVRDYISILYLSYFNAAIIFLPLLFILVLVPLSYVNIWFIVSCALVLLVFAMQFIRASNTVLKSYQFSKFYLFIYLCTLEVGPILILIKLLGI